MFLNFLRGKLASRTYALLYLAVIPLFATIYFRLDSSHLSCATIRQEPAIISLKENVSLGIQRGIESGFRRNRAGTLSRTFTTKKLSPSSKENKEAILADLRKSKKGFAVVNVVGPDGYCQIHAHDRIKLHMLTVSSLHVEDTGISFRISAMYSLDSEPFTFKASRRFFLSSNMNEHTIRESNSGSISIMGGFLIKSKRSANSTTCATDEFELVSYDRPSKSSVREYVEVMVCPENLFQKTSEMASWMKIFDSIDDPTGLKVSLSPQVMSNLSKLVATCNGTLVERNLEYWLRMFYFSCVCITTLGFGDIVPVSLTARMLIAIESILGIILIGYFLYAATSIEQAPSASRTRQACPYKCFFKGHRSRRLRWRNQLY